LLSPTIIASWCASFGTQWGLSQALSWQGAFLIKGLGFTQGSIGSEGMTCLPVSTRVGNVKNNDPSLTEPVALGA
jgi:hypothetical protein